MAIDYTKRPRTPSPAALGKIVLTKAAPTVSLTKRGGRTGLLRVNLNWNARPARRLSGLLTGRSGAIDLDLGCLYEFTDGSKGVVQALGNSFSAAPAGVRQKVIWLDGDDRSGAQSAGENLFIDLGHASAIRRVVVFAFIYEGVPNWAEADGVVTLHPASGPQIEVRLDDPREGARICAIAMIEQSADGLSVRREVNYIDGAQRRLDETYGWGLSWSPRPQVIPHERQYPTMTITLTKGQTVSLAKRGGGTLTRVRMGLGWDAVRKRGLFGSRAQEIDLDASALLFDAAGRLVDQVWFRQLNSADGAVHHTGDNRTGAGDGDDESIQVDLSRLPAGVQTLVFTVNSFTGQDFSQIENASCRLVDETGGDTEIARYDLSASGRHTAQIMAKVSRSGQGWSMTALGVPASGRTFHDLLPALAGVL